MERVSVIRGTKPILLVCPHGADDINTDIITETAASIANCHAVINRGFERSDTVDTKKDLANCNRIDHCKHNVVYEEFLRPIERIEYHSRTASPVAWYLKTDPFHVFHIHGCGNKIHIEANRIVGAVVGYGLGLKKDSLTCELWRKNLFIDLFRLRHSKGEILEGKRGGKYTGRDSNNLNQYWRKHQISDWVQSMQLEFPFTARDDVAVATKTGETLGNILKEYLNYDSYASEPQSHFI